MTERTNKEITLSVSPGMTLRDWFAGMSLMQPQGDVPINGVEEAAYEFADRMIAARETTNRNSLIAAAPDLLAALRTLVMQRDAHFHTAEAWNAARAAIAKAEAIA